MSTWLVWWFVFVLLTTLAIVAVIVGLVRHVLVVGRAAERFQEEVGPLADGIAAEGERASTHAQLLRPPRGLGRKDRG